MSDKKDKKSVKFCFIPMPFVPMWGFPGKKSDEEYEEDWDTFKSNVKTIWEQMRDMQKASVDASKESWNKIFEQTVKMEQSFIDSLPDEAPEGVPDIFTPADVKDFMKKRKEFREEANKYAIEQADSFLDFAKKGQEHVKGTVTDGVKILEDDYKKKKD